MSRPRIPVPKEANIRVNVQMPASTYIRIRDHADATGSSISKLCRDGAVREMERPKTPEAT